MKFIHCADIHLDSKMETNLSSQKAKERKKEILNTFERMVAYAVENNVKGIIIAGDMFDTARITNLTKTRVLNTITKRRFRITFMIPAIKSTYNGRLVSPFALRRELPKL